jgi:hypothetical protein
MRAGSPTLLFQIVNQVGARRFDSGAEAKQYGGEKTKQKRHCQHTCIRRKIDDERKVYVVEQSGQRMQQKIVAPDAEYETDYPATNREQETFAE